jgi:hypothetical protein
VKTVSRSNKHKRPLVEGGDPFCYYPYWLSNLSILKVPGEGYPRNASCTLNLMSTSIESMNTISGSKSMLLDYFISNYNILT